MSLQDIDFIRVASFLLPPPVLEQCMKLFTVQLRPILIGSEEGSGRNHNLRFGFGKLLVLISFLSLLVELFVSVQFVRSKVAVERSQNSAESCSPPSQPLSVVIVRVLGRQSV